MEILKGKVQDPGFPDTEITYLKTDDGKTYFFVENGTLKNGNYIATPILKEGIGHAPYTSLGLVSKDGNVLIPFENKNIQVLSNDLLLVERNKPVTESVVDALNKQSDSLAANELAQNANTIKQQIISVMGSNGSFIFDNQFSEAALYTTDGANLGNNYFSFIGSKDGAYFMSANVVGSQISKYDPYAFAMESENQEQTPADNVAQTENEETTNTEVPQEESVEQELVASAEEVPTTDANQVQSMPEINIPQVGGETPEIPQVEADTQEVANSEEAPATETTEQALPAIDVPQVEGDTAIPSTEVPTQENETVENQTNDINPGIDIPLFGEGGLTTDLPQTMEETPATEVGTEQSTIPTDSIPSTEGMIPQVEGNTSKTPQETETTDTTSTEENGVVGLNIAMDDDISQIAGDDSTSDSEENNTEEDTDSEDEVDNNDSDESDSDDSVDTDEDNSDDSDDSDEEDSSDTDDDDDSEDTEEEMEEENSDSSSDGGEEKEEVEETEEEDNKSDDEVFYEENLDNPIIANATSTIKKLLEENTNQRQQIDNQESELYTLKSNYELLEQDNAAKTKEIISLRNSLGKARRDNTDLLRENNQLKSTISRLEEINEHYKEQNTALKEQVAGISALSSAVAEADSLFGSDTAAEYSYLGGDESYQYTKTAA